MTGESKKLAQEGEQQAAQFLKAKGYRILESNYRCVFGEVDIIAKERGVIYFVEVKTRSDLKCGHPAEALTRAKQKHLTRVALDYLAKHKLLDAPARFDVVTIVRLDGKDEIELIKDAFSIEER